MSVDTCRLYPVTVPLGVGAVQLAVKPTEVTLAAPSAVGAPGSVVTANVPELVPVPDAFTARTRTLYVVPAVSPLTACDVAFTVRSWKPGTYVVKPSPDTSSR